jgi:signal transduction histidine kinase
MTSLVGSLRARRYGPALLVLILSLFLSLAAFTATRTSEQKRRESEFNERARGPAAAVQQNIDLYLEEIQSIGKFYAASRLVERGEFQAFVQGILSRRRAIEALEWAPRVEGAQRRAFEAEAQREISGDFRILELGEDGRRVAAGRRQVYYPVWYVEPFEHNETALGIDLGANPIYANALGSARARDAIAATRPFPLPREDDGELCVAVLVAIYHGGIAVGDPSQEPGDQVHGFVVGVFRVGDLVDEALERARTGLVEVSLYEQRPAATRRVLYPRPRVATAAEDRGAAEPDDGPAGGLVYSTTVQVAGRRWRMECIPTARYLASNKGWMSWAVLAAGLLLTGLLTAYVMTVLGRATWAEGLVAERTAELSQTNERLEEEVRERRRAEDALTARNRELESFVYTASHDLRTPLVSIEGFARLLEEDYADRLDSEGREYLWRVRANAADMDSLLSDLLELSRVTRTQAPKGTVSVAEVVAQALQQLDHAIKDSGATVVVPEDLPTVCASATRLTQVFTNLLSNAIKFSREGADPRVEIAWEKRPDAYRFLVRDNGIGIPEEYRERVFELFTRLKEKEVAGTGIGLAIVKRIVEDHGGELGVESEAGQGSTFWFTLPHTEQGGPTRESAFAT